MKTFILLIHHRNVVLVFFFWKKILTTCIFWVRFIKFEEESYKIVILADDFTPWSSPANPSSSEGTCPKLQRRHTRTQHVDEEEEEDRKQRKSSLSSPLPGHSLLHLHLPTSGRSSTFSGKTLGLSLAPATTLPLWNFGLYHCVFYINELLFCKNFCGKIYLCTYLKDIFSCFQVRVLLLLL